MKPIFHSTACLLAYGTLACQIALAAPQPSLEESFREPPVSARPYVWWHWMGPNFSKSGITKDLEAMKAAGIGGATIFNLTSAVQESQAPTANNPWPDQTYRSPKYWEALKHAAAEADRLGLEIGLHNTVGYSTTGGPWIDEPRSMQRVLWNEITVTGGGRVSVDLPPPAIPVRRGWGGVVRTLSAFRDIAVIAVPDKAEPVAPSEVIDLTKALSADGKLTWNAPAGKWKVYRYVHASTGFSPHPLPDDLIDNKTLEADKMSLEQTRFHWQSVIGPIQQHLGPLVGKSFRHFLIDSYEAGLQNWTPGFREEFIRSRGYDPVPWLATLGNTLRGKTNSKVAVSPLRIIGNADQTARFEWDYREMIAEMFLENGWKPAAKMIHAAGCEFQWEPYSGPFNTIAGTPVADLPMGEFWTGRSNGISPVIRAAGRAAGRMVIGAEAFTGAPGISRWTETPAFLKPFGDGAYLSGVNRLILHHWVHQPYDDRYKPGMGMGWWGTHFGRNQTWAEPGKAYFAYLGRCQALLQRGEEVADYLTLDAATGGDAISPKAFLTDASVDNGRIVLPSGRRYAFLELPKQDAMLPEVLTKVRELVNQGATVAGPVKPTRSPSLRDFPACDETVQRLANELWGDAKGNPTARRIGKGRFLTCEAAAACKELGIEPGATHAIPSVRWVHRHDGDAEIFFLANTSQQPCSGVVSFRVDGKVPEFWNAEDGTRVEAGVWQAAGSRTAVPVELGAEKSIFVVFRKPAGTLDPVAKIEPATATVCLEAGRMVLKTAAPGKYHVTRVSGKSTDVTRACFARALSQSTANGRWPLPRLPLPSGLRRRSRRSPRGAITQTRPSATLREPPPTGRSSPCPRGS